MSLRTRISSLVSSDAFSRVVLAVILLNAVTLGLETSSTAMDAAGPLLVLLDRFALGVFTLELALKLFAFRASFFRSGWNIFDFVVVVISYAPATGSLSVLRAFRILRVLRIFSVLPRLRRIVEALLHALPGMGAIVVVLLVLFYVASVLATTLFGAAFAEWFGTIGRSAYTLFQIMTLESWSMGIVRPVMETYPWAWLFFVPFIICSTFTVLNLFIAVLVSSISSVHEAEVTIDAKSDEIERDELLRTLTDEVRALRREVAALSVRS